MENIKMKVRILNDSDAAVTMALSLKQSGDKVQLMGMDGNGREWYIGAIDSEGLMLYGKILEKSGWPLTREGALRVRGENTKGGR